MSDPDVRPAPPAIPDFEFVRRLGRGGFGEVWLARSVTGVHRAVKIVPAGPGAERELDGVGAFETFAEAHECLVEVRHVGRAGDWLFIVMPLADGYSTGQTFQPDDYVPRTLAEDIRRRGFLDASEVVEVVSWLAAGLDHLHARGVAHGDIKPANVLFFDGRARLADYGLLARSPESAGSYGTRGFAPPEGGSSIAGDVYSLALLAYNALTGLSPELAPRRPPGFPPANERDFFAVLPVLDVACARDPAERFRGAGDLSIALEDAVGAARGTVRPTSSRRAALVGAGLVFAACVAVVVARAVGPPDAEGGRAAAATAPALDADLQVLVRRPGRSEDVTVDERRVPLAAGDAIRFEATFSRPAHVLFVVFENDGAPRRVWPPEDGGPAPPPAARFPFPPDARQRLVLTRPDHPVVALLVARDAPFDAGEIARALESLQAALPLPRLRDDELVRLGWTLGAAGHRGFADAREFVTVESGWERLREPFLADDAAALLLAAPQRTEEE